MPVTQKLQPAAPAHMPGPGTFLIAVVGESHYQDNLAAICGPRKATGEEKYVTAMLIPDDDNQYDNKAVRVEIDNKLIGHLDRNTARRYRQQVESIGHPGLAVTCEAVIRGGWQRSKSDVGHYGVWLDLPATESDKPLGPAKAIGQPQTTSAKRFWQTWWGRVLIGIGLLFACGILSNLLS